MIGIIVPAVVVHNMDPHTGIPFLPHMAAHLGGALDKAGFELQVIDCFGLQSEHRRRFGEFMLLGVDEDWVIQELDKRITSVFVYCRTIEDLFSVERIVRKLKETRPRIKIVLFENVQTTNSFSLEVLLDYLFKVGADVIMMGEPEENAERLLRTGYCNEEMSKIPNIAFRVDGNISVTRKEKYPSDLDLLPFPLWGIFPMQGYWRAGFSHAPISRGIKFLPILTSRGCPYRCKFCVAPAINPTWRGRSASNVVDEIEHLYTTLGVTDFHISDLDPTVQSKRTKNICIELIKRKLPVVWKIAQGTKIETIKDLATLQLLKRAGCVYFSFSPESGSAELMKKLNKPFDYDWAIKIVETLSHLGIRTQACFIAGCPGETSQHRRESILYLKRLVQAGLDEVAVFIYSPIPGSELANMVEGFEHYSQLTRSPTWREDYAVLRKFRRKMYLTFAVFQLGSHPKKVLREIRGVFSGWYETKMEMSVAKLVRLYKLRWTPNLFKRRVDRTLAKDRHPI